MGRAQIRLNTPNHHDLTERSALHAVPGLLVEGYAFMTVAILGLGAVPLLVLGIVGEYVGEYVIAESAGVATKD